MSGHSSGWRLSFCVFFFRFSSVLFFFSVGRRRTCLFFPLSVLNGPPSFLFPPVSGSRRVRTPDFPGGYNIRLMRGEAHEKPNSAPQFLPWPRRSWGMITIKVTTIGTPSEGGSYPLLGAVFAACCIFNQTVPLSRAQLISVSFACLVLHTQNARQAESLPSTLGTISCTRAVLGRTRTESRGKKGGALGA